MKKISMILALFFLSCSPALMEETGVAADAQTREFTNPLSGMKGADPTAIWDDRSAQFICYPTPGAEYTQYLVSEDLVSWKPSGKYLFDSETYDRIKTYGDQIWAPDIVKIGDKYLLYLTVTTPKEKKWGIVVLSSPSMTQEYFRFENYLTGYDITGIKDSIDPEVFEADGKVWMMFGSTGGVFLVELSADGTRIADGAEMLHVAGIDMNRDKTRARCTEGEYVYYRDGWWYLFTSVGAYNNSTYQIIVGRSRSFKGPYLSRKGQTMRKGYGTKILSTRDDCMFFGPGHNGEIFTDSKGDTFMLYHCHVRPEAGKWGPRYLFLQQIFWDKEGWPYFETGHPVASGKAPVMPIVPNPRPEEGPVMPHISTMAEITSGTPVSDFKSSADRISYEEDRRSLVNLSREDLRWVPLHNPRLEVVPGGPYRLYYCSRTAQQNCWLAESPDGVLWYRSQKVDPATCTVTQPKDTVNALSFISAKVIVEKEDANARNFLVSTTYVNRLLEPASFTPTVDGREEDWKDVHDAFFVGSGGQAQIAVRFSSDKKNLYILVDCLDRDIKDGDHVVLKFCDGYLKDSITELWLDAEGDRIFVSGAKGNVTYVPAEGYIAELSVPLKKLPSSGGMLYFNANIVKNGGQFRDGMTGVKSDQPATWIPIRLEEN